MHRRLAVGLSVLALLAVPVYAQLPAPSSTAPVSPPVGQGMNEDWAYVARYRDANQPLIDHSTAQRVVFMGDSITEGWARQPFIKDNANYVGRGISGQTAPQMLVRFRSDVIALKPAIVHIMAGTNDVAQNTGPESPGEIEGYIKSMVELALANRINVVLASIPPAKDFYWHRELEPAPQIRALNAWLREYAASRGLAYIDYWSVLATTDGAMKPEYSADGVHPNAAGYEAMRPLAAAAIERTLRQRQHR
jgi:lysophospholipase L1-like esterase